MRGKDFCGPATAVLLERAPSEPVPLSQVCQQFNLTQREQEVLVHLLQGIRNKEIADRMRISSNTVRAFLRLIMIKTGVSSRSAIVGKILTTQRCTELITSPLLARATVPDGKVPVRPGYQMQFGSRSAKKGIATGDNAPRQ